MKRSLASIFRKSLHQAARCALSLLPRSVRFSLFRNLIDSCLFESSLNEELQRDLAEVTVGRGVHSPGARGHGLH
jgi:hypothetical protein